VNEIYRGQETYRETLENTLAAIFSNRANSKRTGVKILFETTLVSKDRLIIGRPDMVIMTSEGPIINRLQNRSL